MPRYNVGGPTLLISNGATNSNVITARADFGDADLLAILALAIDASKTYKFQVSNDNVTWFDWTDGSSIIVPPLSGQASTYGQPGFAFLRIVASAAVGSDSTWFVTKGIGARQ